jgi:hypothetical protein
VVDRGVQLLTGVAPVAVEVLVCQITTVAKTGGYFINFSFSQFHMFTQFHMVTQFHILQDKITFVVCFLLGNSPAPELPRRKYTTFRKRRKFETNNKIAIRRYRPAQAHVNFSPTLTFPQNMKPTHSRALTYCTRLTTTALTLTSAKSDRQMFMNTNRRIAVK